MKNRVAWGKLDCSVQSDDRIVPFFLGNLNVGARSERIECGSFTVIRAVEFSERGIILLLFEQQMNQSSACGGTVRSHGQVVPKRVGGFGLLFAVQRLR